MRNSTKLKHILRAYTLELSVNNKDWFEAVLTQNSTGNSCIVKGQSMSELLRDVTASIKIMNYAKV